jgi:hypothetical protein
MFIAACGGGKDTRLIYALQPAVKSANRRTRIDDEVLLDRNRSFGLIVILVPSY